MDSNNRHLHNDFFAYTLALLNRVNHHQKGDRERLLDLYSRRGSNRYWNSSLYAFGIYIKIFLNQKQKHGIECNVMLSILAL